jgi:AcrR family transcriptional regulator
LAKLPAATRSSAKSRQRRAANAESIRRDLLEAAEIVVGKNGYADASIARITKIAGVAGGTFYLYFPSRQALFDQLLPTLGARLAEFIRASTDADATGLQYDRQRIIAYFEFCRLNPGFLRIYHEAAIFAPRAYRKHFQLLADGYRETIGLSQKRGELPHFDESEIEALIHILMGARSYLSLLHGSSRKGHPASALIEVYLKVVESGVFGAAKINGGVRPRRSKSRLSAVKNPADRAAMGLLGNSKQ